VLQEILGKFDLLDQRLAVIKKYAKYGSNARIELPTTKPGDPEGKQKTGLQQKWNFVLLVRK